MANDNAKIGKGCDHSHSVKIVTQQFQYLFLFIAKGVYTSKTV